MSLRPHQPEPVPEETARVVRLAFPRGNRYMRMRDELDSIYADDSFATLFPRRGQPAESPWHLALATVFQFAEGLSDREAADAVRSRIDWKYALSLELTDPGFDHTVLSEFRSRLLSGERRGGTAPARSPAGTPARARLAQSPRAPTDRFGACAGSGPRAQPGGVGGRDAACRAQQLGGGGSRVAAGPCPAGMGRPLRAAGHRGPAAPYPRAAPAPGPNHRGGCPRMAA